MAGRVETEYRSVRVFERDICIYIWSLHKHTCSNTLLVLFWINCYQIINKKKSFLFFFLIFPSFIFSSVLIHSVCRPKFLTYVIYLLFKMSYKTSLLTTNSVSFCSSDKVFIFLYFGSVQLSDSLPPHGLQHARLPCPSPTPGAYPNSCPLSQWCHPTISSSVIPFSTCPQSFPASGSFQMSQLFASGGQSIGASASTSV